MGKTLPPDVTFRAVPAGLNLMGVDEITVFHTLEAMGQRERLHKKIFEALHKKTDAMALQAIILIGAVGRSVRLLRLALARKKLHKEGTIGLRVPLCQNLFLHQSRGV